MALSICASAVANPQIETVIVTADFRDAELLKMPASVSVLSADVIRQRNAQHLEQMLTLAPNVNISSGSSRARFIQIRGIGERSQFAQPIDPSVGLVIDDVDFTGIGAAATMFDVRQVEVLRGPQGIRYGANALAGIVAIQSQQPTENFEGYVDASISEYDTWSLGAAAGGAISDSLLYRVAVQKNTSDGFIENDYLNKDDTNNIDELTSRVKLKWLASEKVTINTSFLFADIDNGYDAFSLDNNRTTLSDEPGHDRQKTRALSIKADVDVSTAINFQTIASYASSDLEYGYDEDWSYVGICSDFPCDGYDYATTDNYKRDRQNGSVELRLLSDEAGRIFNDSTDWLIGVYFSEQSVELDRDYFDWDAFSDANLMSEYDTKNLALFAELSSSLSEKMTLTYGLRIEDWTAEYSDSNAVVLDNDDTLYGGKLVLDYQYADNSMAYASVARGYKAGGVNIDSTLAEINREFDTEFQWAYELGLKNILLDGRLST
ncbi:MAG: outer membrane receptor protein involved in Fe transport, partial [Pseudohongiellaceae bacterium]